MGNPYHSESDQIWRISSQDSDDGEIGNPPKLSNFGSELISDAIEKINPNRSDKKLISEETRIHESHSQQLNTDINQSTRVTHSASSPLYFEDTSPSTMFVQSQASAQPSATTYDISSQDYSDSSKSFIKLKSKQDILKQELTTRYSERRTRRFLHATNRTTKLGPALRNLTSPALAINDNNSIDNKTNETSKVNSSFDTNNAYVDFHQTKQDIYTSGEEHNNTKDNGKIGATQQNDYSDINIHECNPIQYMKMHNLPTSELSKISKAYFEKQKEENRKKALKNVNMKQSLNYDLKYYSNSSPSIESGKENNLIHNTEIEDFNGRGHSTNNHSSSYLSNSHSHLVSTQFVESANIELEKPTLKKSLSNADSYRHTQREALQNIDVNSNVRDGAIDYKRQKIALKDSEFDGILDKKKYRGIKRVEIVEPPTSTRPPSRKNVVSVNGTEYERVELLGRGGSSNVYKVRGLKNRVYALKKVSFDEFDESSVEGFKGEISLLKQLQNQNRVVQLYDYEMGSGVLYLLMECGDYDLSQVLHQRTNQPFDMEFIRYHAREMVTCVKVVHDAGIVHSDLKPANFVFVKGILKIIDFGIANAVPDHTVNIYRDMQIGTPNYMAPEALVANNYTADNDGKYDQKTNKWKIGKPADIWSCGCIIYQMIYGKPPYAKYQGQERLLSIMDPNVKIEYKEVLPDKTVIPSLALELMQYCLMRNPEERWSALQILDSPFLNPLMVSQDFIKNLITTAVSYGAREGDVSPSRLEALTDSVLARLADFRMH